MRPFRSHAARWPISVLCILSLGLSLCTTLLIVPAVSAQGTISQVAVIDFRNASKMPGQMFGRMATDAVVLELIRSGKFGVIPSDSLEATMKQLGYDANMNESAMVRLGQETEATSVVSGEVLSIKVDKDKKKAEARIAVKLLDVASGEVVNGAVASGISQPRIGYTADEDKMLVEALKDAARNAVESMVAYIIPEATVLNSVGTSEVLLNKGSQEGIEPGMEMIVLRRTDGSREEVVGRIRINKVTDSDSMGTIINAPRGVKPEDRVRAVYKMPDYSEADRVAAPKKTNRKSLTSGSKLLWGLIALIGIATLFKPGGGDENEEVPDAVAMAGTAPDVQGRTGDSGIMIAWNDLGNMATDDIIEWHVWMDNYGNVPMGNDGPYTGPVQAIGHRGAMPFEGSGWKYDHFTVMDTDGWAPFTYNYADQDHAQASVTIDNQTGVTIGRTHTFYVSALYRRMNPTTGEYTFWETSPVLAGRSTLVTRPTCVAPDMATDVQLSNVAFEWGLSQGADQYRLEVSGDPAFSRSKTWCKDVPAAAAANGTYTVVNELDHAPELASLDSDQPLFWRVGARCTRDTNAPYPYGDGASYAASGSKNTRFIYCDQVMQFTAATPPGPDDGTGGGGGDDDDDGPPPPPDGI